MKRPNLSKYLLQYINSKDCWINKVDLYIVGNEIEHSAESVGRSLRILAEEGKIKVDYYQGKYVKGLARYSRNDFKQVSLSPKFTIVEINGERKAVLVK